MKFSSPWPPPVERRRATETALSLTWQRGACKQVELRAFQRGISGRSVSRILSSHGGASMLGRSSLWAACYHAARRGLPGTGCLPVEAARVETSSLPPSANDFVPAWPCSRRGLPGRTHYCARRWSFTPPFHPCPISAFSQGEKEGAVCFCGPFRQVHASQRFPRPGYSPTPCSMECGLSSTPTTQGRDRPTDLRHLYHTCFILERQLPAIWRRLCKFYPQILCNYSATFENTPKTLKVFSAHRKAEFTGRSGLQHIFDCKGDL